MTLRYSTGLGRVVAAETDVVITSADSWPQDDGTVQRAKPPLIYCHGAGSTGVSQYDVNLLRRMLADLSEDFVVGMFDLGGDQFGNDLSMGRINTGLDYLREEWGATDDPPMVVGLSMGGCVALNYALDYPVMGVAAGIPLLDLNAAYVGNILGLAAAIAAAYGGTWDEAIDGPQNDPMDFASSLDADIPIRLFPTTDDSVLASTIAAAFAALRPETTVQRIGGGGHTTKAFDLMRPYLVPWVQAISNDEEPPAVVPAAEGPNATVNPTFETNTTGWTAFGAGTALTRDTTEHHSGVASLKIASSVANGGAYATTGLATTLGTKYVFRAWVKGTGNLRMMMYRATGNVTVAYQDVALTGSWQEIEVEHTMTGDQTSITPFFRQNGAGTMTAYVDDVAFAPAADAA